MELRRLLPNLRRAVGDDRRVLVGFDRGGWSTALFGHMDAEGFDVLTWRKGYAEDVDEPLFGDAAYTDETGRTHQWRVVDTIVDLSIDDDQMFTMRQVSLLVANNKTGRGEHPAASTRQIHILTTRTDLPIEQVIYRMGSRWRQENYFRYARMHFDLDSHDAYATIEDGPTRLVPNPAKKIAHQQVLALGYGLGHSRRNFTTTASACFSPRTATAPTAEPHRPHHDHPFNGKNQHDVSMPRFPRVPRASNLAWTAGGGAGAAFAAISPQASIGVILAASLAGMLVRFGGRVLVFVTLIAAIATLPTVLPSEISLSRGTVYLYELPLVMAALWAVGTGGFSRVVESRAWILGGLLLLGAVAGLGLGYSSRDLQADLHGPIDMALGLVVGARVAQSPALIHSCLRVIKWCMWWSAALTLLAGAGVLTVSGRTESAGLFLANGSTLGGGAIRILSSATHPSLVVACASLALGCAGRARLRQILPFLTPALVVVFLSFSRNSLLALAAAILFGVVAGRSTHAAGFAAAVTATLVAVTAVSAVALAVLAPSALASVSSQGAAYQERVLTGLTSQTSQMDSSTLYRLSENERLFYAVKDSPLLGHGFGYPYKPAAGEPGSFEATSGRIYAHNFYLWLLAKVGILGLLAFVYVTVPPVVGALQRHASTVVVALAAGTASLLAVNFVAPMPLGSSESLTFGLLVGLLHGLRLRAGFLMVERFNRRDKRGPTAALTKPGRKKLGEPWT